MNDNLMVFDSSLPAMVDMMFSRDHEGAFHDVLANLGETNLSAKRCREMFDKLPDSLKHTAIEWGLGDTVFRDGAFEYLMETVYAKKSV